LDSYISLRDLFLVPLYALVFTLVLYRLSQSFKSPSLRKYFLVAGILKLIAGIGIALLYVYYYKYGDTLRFFRFGQFYKDILLHSPEHNFMQALFMSNQEFINIISYKIDYAYGFASSSFVVNKFSAFFSIFAFDSFLVTTLFFAMFSYSGIWKLYVTFVRLFPKLYKDLAVAILFFPSVVFWGSGLMKDSLCIGAMGWLTWGIYNLLFTKTLNKVKLPIYLVVVLLSFWLIMSIKVYIIMTYMAGMTIWVLFFYRDKIQNKVIRTSITPILLGLSAPALIIGLQAFSDDLGKYAIENVVETALSLTYNLQSREAGSSYSLGAIDPSLAGLLSKFPLAVNVTLFRPYLWEVRNPIMLLAALESLVIFYWTLKVIFKVGPGKTISSITSNGSVIFCLVYSIIFGFAVGLSSQNFGSLVRYKIPAMPFYLAGIFILYYVNTGHSIFQKDEAKQHKKTRPVKSKTELLSPPPSR
jgi:hypothetical protein